MIKSLNIEDCFKVLTLQSSLKNKEDAPSQIFVPTVVQFKIRELTDVNFDNLTASINGVLCISFLIFTQDQIMDKFLLNRLFWSSSVGKDKPSEIDIVDQNRRKKVKREKANYIPITFGKDTNVKLPTTRIQQHDIQTYVQEVFLQQKQTKRKENKDYSQNYQKNQFWEEFMSPFRLVNLQMEIQIDQMNVRWDENLDNLYQTQKQKQQQYLQLVNRISSISFNILRIQQPFQKKQYSNQNDQDNASIRQVVMSPIISYANNQQYWKYSVAYKKLQGYSHDQRHMKSEQAFQDSQPVKLPFKPFKFITFKIPLYSYYIVDILTIFVPIFLLSFLSCYLYWQNSDVLNRILNVASIMIAYAAIQPIVRQNIPDATSITLVDLIFYIQLIGNLIFIGQSITYLNYYDTLSSPPTPSQLQYNNQTYDRYTDAGFILSIIFSVISLLIILVLCIWFYFQIRNYKTDVKLHRSKFEISDKQNWNLSLMMKRSFARYQSPPVPYVRKMQKKSKNRQNDLIDR